MKYKLRGVNRSLGGINRLINEYFYSNIQLRSYDDHYMFSLWNKKGIIKDFYVVFKGSKYLFREVI